MPEPSLIRGPMPNRRRAGRREYSPRCIIRLFLALLTTAFASNIGIWMQEVGASWLMT